MSALEFVNTLCSVSAVAISLYVLQSTRKAEISKSDAELASTLMLMTADWIHAARAFNVSNSKSDREDLIDEMHDLESFMQLGSTLWGDGFAQLWYKFNQAVELYLSSHPYGGDNSDKRQQMDFGRMRHGLRDIDAYLRQKIQDARR